MNLLKVALVRLLLWLPCNQGIYLKLYDEQNQAIQHIVVKLYQGDRCVHQMISDGDGMVCFVNLKDKRYTVRIDSQQGYLYKEINDVKVHPRQMIRCELKKKQPLFLFEVSIIRLGGLFFGLFIIYIKFLKMLLDIVDENV